MGVGGWLGGGEGGAHREKLVFCDENCYCFRVFLCLVDTLAELIVVPFFVIDGVDNGPVVFLAPVALASVIDLSVEHNCRPQWAANLNFFETLEFVRAVAVRTLEELRRA